jgi:very-short-patch-repair endonuclease
MSLPEVLVWQKIRPSVSGMFNLRRQHPVVDSFVQDFFYPDLQLAIEIDGKYVREAREELDAIRQEKIEALGIAFVRFPARWVLRDPKAVASLIISLCAHEIDID